MKISKLIAIITIIAATPNFGFIFYLFFSYHASTLNWIVIEKILTALSCIVGGALLWRENIWGYRISIIAWILILFVSISSIYVAVSHTTNIDLQLVMLSKDLIISLCGGIILVILLKGALRAKS